MLLPDKQPVRSIERLLDEFELRRPRALPEAASSHLLGRRLAAAAGILAACGVSLWLVRAHGEAGRSPSVTAIVREEPEHYQRASSLALTRMALGDPSRFEAELSKASRNSLPNFERRDSALRALTKE
jgi:hypothetical protein